jgi:hypothetical protein
MFSTMKEPKHGLNSMQRIFFMETGEGTPTVLLLKEMK